MWILLAILALPILEILLFVQFGPSLGVLGTLGEILATGALGVLLIRLEPHRNAEQLRVALAQEQSPASPLAHSALRLLAGILLVLPGFFTDAAGLLLLLPPVRAVLLNRFFETLRDTHLRAESTVIDGEYETAEPDHPAGQKQIKRAHIPAREQPQKRD